MTSTTRSDIAGELNRIIDSVGDVQGRALEAVRKLVDTVDDAFPDINEEGPRRKIIDSAFRMTEQVIGASTEFAQKLVKVTNDALLHPENGAPSSK